MVLDSEYDGMKKFKKSLNDPSHRVLRYVLKVGDLEEATHIFVDLLEMRVFNHQEYDSGSADGGEVHYEGKWSRTLVGYGKTVESQLHLQLTVNHGVAKYSRGNHVHSIEVQLESVKHLEDVGLKKGFCRGKPAFLVNCNGYSIEVVKSDDGKKRISCITLNCDETITLSGPTVNFWTNCLGFEVVCWSADPESSMNILTEYSWAKCNLCCCCLSRVIKRRSKFRPLQEDEQPFVELQYGSTRDFRVRLQTLPGDVEMDIGTGRERLVLTCTAANLIEIRKLVKMMSRQTGGSETKKSFQLIPGQSELLGVVASDPSGLEVCYYDAEEVRLYHESQLDAEVLLRKSISVNRQKKDERAKRKSSIFFLMNAKGLKTWNFRKTVGNHIYFIFVLSPPGPIKWKWYNTDTHAVPVQEIPAPDEIIKRLQGHRGVQGVIVTTKDGTPIRSTMDNTSTVLYVGRLKILYTLASSMVRDVDPTDRLLFLRIRTSKHEMMLSSNAGDDYMAIVIQNPNEA